MPSSKPLATCLLASENSHCTLVQPTSVTATPQSIWMWHIQYCLKRPENQNLTQAQLGIFVGIQERNGSTIVYMPHSGRLWNVCSPTTVETSYTRPLDSTSFAQNGALYDEPTDSTLSYSPIPTGSLHQVTSFENATAPTSSFPSSESLLSPLVSFTHECTIGTCCSTSSTTISCQWYIHG